MLSPLTGTLGPLGRARGNASSLLTGLLAYWTLDETTGTRLDASGNGYGLTPTAITSTAGLIGQSAGFTGSPSHLEQGTGAPWHLGAASFTLAGWAWFTDLSNYRPLLTKDGLSGTTREWALGTDQASANKIYFALFDATGSGNRVVFSSAAPSTGSWHHLVARYDASAATLTLTVDNGTPTSVSTAGFTPGSAGTARLMLGTYDPLTLFHSGRMDEWGIWARALTAAEGSALYNSGAGLTYPFS